MSIRAHVDARRLDQLVRWERNFATDTASGGRSPDDWRAVATTWAAVDGAKASSPEPVSDGGIRTPRAYTIWIRADVFKRFGLTALDRAIWKGSIMNILDMPDQGLRGRMIAVICRTGLNQG